MAREISFKELEGSVTHRGYEKMLASAGLSPIEVGQTNGSEDVFGGKVEVVSLNHNRRKRRPFSGLWDSPPRLSDLPN